VLCGKNHLLRRVEGEVSNSRRVRLKALYAACRVRRRLLRGRPKNHCRAGDTGVASMCNQFWEKWI
jgi:hypothetical protein